MKTATASQGTGIVYDATSISRLLGIRAESSDPPPQSADGEVVVYYGGWKLKELRSCTAGKKLMWDEDWYDQHEWQSEPGYYRLLLPIPHSQNQSWNEQITHLRRSSDQAWQPAPVCVAATALLANLTEAGSGLLPTHTAFCRCEEPLSGEGHVVLMVYDGRVRARYYWDGYRVDSLWLAVARKSWVLPLEALDAS